MKQFFYRKHIGLDPEAFASGEYVLAVGPAIGLQETYPVLPVPSVGSSVEIAGKQRTVMAVVYPVNSVCSGASQAQAEQGYEISFILPSETFREQWPENTLRRLFVNVDDAHLEQTQEFLEEYTRNVDTSLPVVSRQVMMEQYQAETRSSAVMRNAVSITIALVGILNFINSMVTSIVSRKKEFAVIQSVGMTKRQLCRMLVEEGLYYAAITLAASLLAGSLAVGIGVRAMVEGGYTTFRFTLFPLAVCAPALILLAAAVPYVCFRNLEKQSVVERLRTE